jgi:aspartate 1-decarboxylase
MNNTIIKDNDLRFVWSIKTDKSTSQEVDLIPNGKDILVDDSNKQRFIQELYLKINLKNSLYFI